MDLSLCSNSGRISVSYITFAVARQKCHELRKSHAPLIVCLKAKGQQRRSALRVVWRKIRGIMESAGQSCIHAKPSPCDFSMNWSKMIKLSSSEANHYGKMPLTNLRMRRREVSRVSRQSVLTQKVIVADEVLSGLTGKPAGSLLSFTELTRGLHDYIKTKKLRLKACAGCGVRIPSYATFCDKCGRQQN